MRSKKSHRRSKTFGVRFSACAGGESRYEASEQHRDEEGCGLQLVVQSGPESRGAQNRSFYVRLVVDPAEQLASGKFASTADRCRMLVVLDGLLLVTRSRQQERGYRPSISCGLHYCFTARSYSFVVTLRPLCEGASDELTPFKKQVQVRFLRVDCARKETSR